MFGLSTFGIAMALLKWIPLRLVDKFLLLVTNLTLGNTDRLGLRRPKTGPIELKNATGKTPVLDVGVLSLIKSGKVKVPKHALRFFSFFFSAKLQVLINSVDMAGDGRCERDNKKWGQVHGWTRKRV